MTPGICRRPSVRILGAVRRALLQLLSVPAVIALSAGCVDVPDDDPFADDAGQELPGDLCQAGCAFPPVEDGFQTELLPAAIGQVDGNGDEDMVIGNGPEDPAYWGFFFVSDLSAQTGEVTARPFKRTQRRPLAIHLEEYDGNFSRVVVFGENDQGIGIEVYEWDTFEFRQPPASNDYPATPKMDDETAVLAVGVFNSNDAVGQGLLPDAVFGYGEQLYVWDCSMAGCGTIVPLNAGDVIEAGDDIELIQAIPSALEASSSLIDFDPEGEDDIVLAGDGAIRYLSFARDTDTQTREWRSLEAFSSFLGGVMGNMSTAWLPPGEFAGASRVLVQGGAGNNAGAVDLTTLYLDDTAGVTPLDRVRYDEEVQGAAPWTDQNIVAARLLDLGGGSAPELVVVGELDGNHFLYVQGDIGTIINEVEQVYGPTGASAGAVLELPVQSLTAVDGRIWIFSPQGACASFVYDGTDSLQQTDTTCQEP